MHENIERALTKKLDGNHTPHSFMMDLRKHLSTLIVVLDEAEIGSSSLVLYHEKEQLTKALEVVRAIEHAEGS